MMCAMNVVLQSKILLFWICASVLDLRLLKTSVALC